MTDARSKVAEAIMLLTSILGVRGSSIDRETNYPDRRFREIPQSSRQLAGKQFKSGQDSFLPNHSKFIIHYHPVCRRTL
jgi:hypothetical protein